MTKKAQPSLISTPFFQVIGPHLRIETYDRDGGHKRPRHRIELASSTPQDVVAQALALTMPCISCGATNHPFRARAAPSKRNPNMPRHVYYACACPLDVSIGCSRGNAASDEYARIVQAAEAYRRSA